MEDKKESDSWVCVSLEVETGRQPFVLVIPLGLNKEQRATVMRMLSDSLDSMRRAYDPRPCRTCLGSGDARDGVPVPDEVA